MTSSVLNRELNEAARGMKHGVETSPAVLEGMTMVELRELAQEYEVSGRARMRKRSLATALLAMMSGRGN